MRPNKLHVSDVKITAVIALLVLPLIGGVAHAQEATPAGNIIRPQPDPNGVDLVTSGLMIPEPSFGAPGASRLQLSIGRSERGNEINPLYTTLRAQQLDWFGDGAEWPRMYTAVVNGMSVRFICHVGLGSSMECDESSPRRGAVLEDVNDSYESGYIYTAPDGTRAQFGPFVTGDLGNEMLEALEVVYPSGEKIAFQHTLQSGVATRLWTSNIGYSVSSAYTSSIGGETRRLYKGGSLLNTITGIRENISGSGMNVSYTRKVTDDLGRIVRIRYVPANGPQWNQFSNSIAWFEDATGLRTTISYHGINYVAYGSFMISALERNGKTWSYLFGYNTDPLAAVREIGGAPSSDSPAYFGNVTSSKTPLGQTTSFEYYDTYNYLQMDLLKTVTFPEGNKLKYEYDDRGNLTKTTEVPKTGGAGHIVYQASFPPTCSNRKTCNRPDWTRDGAGSQTDYTYDSTHGGLLTKLEPVDANGKRRKTWNEYTADNTGNGNVYRLSATHVCSILSSGTNIDCQTTAEQVQSFTYWEHTLLPLTETRTNGTSSVSATTTYTYDAWGHVLSVVDPTGVAKYFRYDIMGRKTWDIAASGSGGGSWVALKTTYDNGDRVTRIDRGYMSDPASTSLQIRGSTISTYDVEGRRIKSEFVDSVLGRVNVEQASYDAVSRPICSVKRMNPAAFDSTADACTVGPIGTFGSDRITKNTYDLDGRLTKTVEGFAVLNSGSGITSVEAAYTTNGQVWWRKDGNSNQTTYTYDSYDRQYRQIFADSSFEQSEYDSAGRLWRFTKRNGQYLTHGYDGASRLTSTTFSNGEPTVTRGYDGQGRPTTVSRGGQTITEVWGDALGRLSSEIQPAGTVSYQYDLSGRRSRITWPGSYWVDYDYNSAGSLWRVRELGATSGLGVLGRWTFDEVGRRLTLTTGNGVLTGIVRDGADRLIRLDHDTFNTALDILFTYQRNPAGQIASRTFNNASWVWVPPSASNAGYVPDALNRYSSVGGATFSYDGNGNLTNDGSRTYGYDFLNHLTSVSGGGAPAAALTYDPLDRLQTISANGLTTRFLYDGARMIAEYDGSGNLLRRFVPGVGANIPLVWLEGSATAANSGSAPNTVWWPMADERSSVVGWGNAVRAVAINRYGSYGEPAATNVGRFGYTGQLWLPEIGLYHYRARVYNPRLGRFMQTDPIGYGDGLNLYAYVRNDPLNYFDPTGTEGGPTSYVDHERRTPDPNRPELVKGLIDYAKVLQKYPLVERERELERLRVDVSARRFSYENDHRDIKNGKMPNEVSGENPNLRQAQILEQRIDALAKAEEILDHHLEALKIDINVNRAGIVAGDPPGEIPTSFPLVEISNKGPGYMALKLPEEVSPAVPPPDTPVF